MIHDEVKNPFPGLRPFEFDDNHLFFGRDEQTTELTTRLRKNRFVAVVGTSGSGKSSLVRAGLMPELLSGTMASAGSSWETTIMRPGGDPITNLAAAIVEADLYDSGEEDIASQVRATLTRSGLGLVEAIRQSELPAGSNFLLVVDQFEEIFRFRRSDDATDEQAAFFVNLLLEASAQVDLPLYIIITMRSDFLGECSQFPRLADTVNEGEFLIPRLNRDQRKEAIIGPVKVAGGRITDRLLLRLLNDIGDDPDQLPILQHALMRTWDLFEEQGGEGELDLEHYQATGGMGEALSRHADEVYGELVDDEHKRIAEKLFKSLTEKVDANRGIRRPMQLAELHEICGGEELHLREVLDAFRKTGCTFLMPAGDVKIKTKTIIDISHESLMRAWRSLRNWVDEEAQSAKIYRRLADTATLYKEDKAGLYRDPDLQIALSWREENRPNKTWADRYYSGFEGAMAFLDQSHEEAIREEREREEARKREVEQAKALAEAEQQKADAMERLAITQKRRAIFATILSLIAIAATIVAGVAWKQAKESEEKAILALVSGQELLQEDVDKALEIMQAQEGGLSQFAESMRQKSGSYVRSGDFKSALIAINAANKIDQSHKFSKLFSGRINLALENFNQAISDVDTFAVLDINSPSGEGMATIWWMFGASIIAKTGNVNSYTNYCQKMFERFPTKNSITGERVAKGALMLNSDPKQIKKCLDYTLHANKLRKGTGFYNWSCFSVGLAQFRSGNLKEAEQRCHESLEHTPETHPWLPGLNNALLSMIYFKTNRQVESKKTRQTAKECLSNLEGNENGLHDTFLMELLIKERELLGEK